MEGAVREVMSMHRKVGAIASIAAVLIAGGAAWAEAPHSLRRSKVLAKGLVGLSDLATAPDGTLWTLSERQHLLIPLKSSAEGATFAGTPLPIEGIRRELDVEALAFVDERTLLIGTEQREEHDEDLLLVVRLEAGRARVVERIVFSYEEWKKSAEPNRGLEGACVTGQDWVVASEEDDRHRGARYGLVARYRPATKQWSRYRVPLSSEKGRLAGIACRAAADGSISALAIERGKGTTRVIHFTLPPVEVDRSKPLKIDQVEVTIDLERPLAGFNVEGIAWLADDRIVLVTDNSDRGEPTQLITLTPAPPQSVLRE